MTRAAILFTLLFITTFTFADVRLPRIFSDGMVLQRNQAIPIWGWADPNEKVTVVLNRQTVSTKAGKDGKWKVYLKAEKEGGPYQLTVSGKNKITLGDVLVGDVWVCSGQSNMEWNVKSANNSVDEIQQANYPKLRQFLVQKAIAGTPQEDVKSDGWKSAVPENVGNFTAVGYFFAREIFNETKVPVGLINTTWGGTIVETWTSREAFENHEEFKSVIAKLPRLDIEALAAQQKKALMQKMQDLQGGLPSPEEINTFSKKGIDDSKWGTMKLPGAWETQQLKDFDGTVWFRKTITLKKEDTENEATLLIGKIDDSDETFVNGVKVGGLVNEWNTIRNYKISKGTLQEGENVIAIKVEDTGGGGGVMGDSTDLKLISKNTTSPLAGNWKFKVASIKEGVGAIGPNSYPTLLFNGMVNPLIPYGIKGALWYQGESNAGRAFQYRKAFPLMITDWRKRWAQGDFPFYFVQLSSYKENNGDSNKGSTWGELREAQTLTLTLPNTGMAVTTDIGESNDIHPKNKQDVGKRLAAVALKNTYGKDTIASGPTYKSMKIEGNKAVISFENTGSGLMIKDKYGYIKGFEVAGEDKKFFYAKAAIEGNNIILTSENVQAPVAVRYGWADDASDTNLFNKEGFPAAPFRTDNWKGITEDVNYSVQGL